MESQLSEALLSLNLVHGNTELSSRAQTRPTARSFETIVRRAASIFQLLCERHLMPKVCICVYIPLIAQTFRPISLVLFMGMQQTPREVNQNAFPPCQIIQKSLNSPHTQVRQACIRCESKYKPGHIAGVYSIPPLCR